MLIMLLGITLALLLRRQPSNGHDGISWCSWEQNWLSS